MTHETWYDLRKGELIEYQTGEWTYERFHFAPTNSTEPTIFHINYLYYVIIPGCFLGFVLASLIIICCVLKMAENYRKHRFRRIIAARDLSLMQ